MDYDDDDAGHMLRDYGALWTDSGRTVSVTLTRRDGVRFPVTMTVAEARALAAAILSAADAATKEVIEK